MATPFFGKREETSTGTRPSTVNTYTNPLSSPPPPLATVNPVSDSLNSPDAGASKLTVGLNIKLKGVEITDCDTLVVDGTVEATINSRVMQISEQGTFRGSAEIDLAEIRGEFNGNLTVRQKLVIYGTGKVSGTIRYGKLVVEEGAQLSGEIVFGTHGHASVPSKPAVAPTPMPKPELETAGVSAPA